MSVMTMTSAAAGDVDSQVTISDSSASTSYRFSIPVPSGGTLRAADSSRPGAQTRSDVLVQDVRQRVVGAYDAAWALDAAGRPVDSTFRIEGTQLIQTVYPDSATEFPVSFGLAYTPVSVSGRTAPGAETSSSSSFVSVPSNYVYNPALGSLHDYCTAAPDEFHAPFAANANFRGPCARHDLCYAGSTSERTCDYRLRSDMRTNCAYQYSSYNPLRTSCYRTADIYYAAVIAA